MISEDWCNDAENSALITELKDRILKYIKMHKHSLKIVIIFHSIKVFFCIFNQINAGLMKTLS